MRRVLGVNAAFLLGACATAPIEPTIVETVPQTRAEFVQKGWDSTLPRSPEFRFGAGDELTLRFYSAPELDRTLRVLPNGALELPYLEPIRAAGRSLTAVEADLMAAFSKELRDPTLQAYIAALGSNSAFVAGHVEKPGEIMLSGDMTVGQAIIAAGGLKPGDTALSIHHYRVEPEGSLARATFFAANTLNDLLQAEPQRLERFDIIYVQPSDVAANEMELDAIIVGALPQSYAQLYQMPQNNR